MDTAESTILQLTSDLLQAIRESDWNAYERLCAEDLTCFEPEACGNLVTGLGFHRFYFDLGGHMGRHADTVVNPVTTLLGEDAAVIRYVRVVQSTDEQGRAQSASFEETRIWLKREGQWKHVHFHRSRVPH